MMLLLLKQLWNNLFINKFCSVFVFQKRPSIYQVCVGLKVSAFFLWKKILSDSNFRMGFECLAWCMRDHTQRTIILSNKLSIISLCDYSN
jgi:hypothetical protein